MDWSHRDMWKRLKSALVSGPSDIYLTNSSPWHIPLQISYYFAFTTPYPQAHELLLVPPTQKLKTGVSLFHTRSTHTVCCPCGNGAHCLDIACTMLQVCSELNPIFSVFIDNLKISLVYSVIVAHSLTPLFINLQYVHPVSHPFVLSPCF